MVQPEMTYQSYYSPVDLANSQSPASSMDEIYSSYGQLVSDGLPEAIYGEFGNAIPDIVPQLNMQPDAAQQEVNDAATLRVVLRQIRQALKNIADGPLAAWRMHQKMAVYGQEPPAGCINDVKVRCQELANKWAHWRHRLDRFVQAGMVSDPPSLYTDFEIVLRELVQKTLVVEWSSGDGDETDQPMNHQPPMVIRKECSGDKLNFHISILCATTALMEWFQSYGVVQCQFIKPVELGQNTTSLQKDAARHLMRGNLAAATGVYGTAGCLQSGGGKGRRTIRGDKFLAAQKIEFDDQDILTASYENLVFNLRCKRSDDDTISARRNIDKRSKETKYHILAVWKLSPKQGREFMLSTLSLPFMISVAKPQDTTLYGQLFWQVLASDFNDVTCEPSDTAQITWEKLKPALRVLFKKLTGIRELDNHELRHLGSRFMDTANVDNDRPPSNMPITKEMLIEPNKLSEAKEGQQDKWKMGFSFFDWFYGAVEMIIDKDNQIARQNMPIRGRNTAERRTMCSLLQDGVIHGFVSRDRATRLLSRCDQPAMLIRFSDHYIGHLTISYKRDTAKIDHMRPMGRKWLAGITLPSMVSMMLQLKRVDDILCGFDTAGAPLLKNKMSLIQDHIHATMTDYDEFYSQNPVLVAPGSHSRQRTPAAFGPSSDCEDFVSSLKDFASSCHPSVPEHLNRFLAYMEDPQFQMMFFNFEHYSQTTTPHQSMAQMLPPVFQTPVPFMGQTQFGSTTQFTATTQQWQQQSSMPMKMDMACGLQQQQQAAPAGTHMMYSRKQRSHHQQKRFSSQPSSCAQAAPFTPSPCAMQPKHHGFAMTPSPQQQQNWMDAERQTPSEAFSWGQSPNSAWGQQSPAGLQDICTPSPTGYMDPTDPYLSGLLSPSACQFANIFGASPASTSSSVSPEQRQLSGGRKARAAQSNESTDSSDSDRASPIYTDFELYSTPIRR